MGGRRHGRCGRRTDSVLDLESFGLGKNLRLVGRVHQGDFVPLAVRMSLDARGGAWGVRGGDSPRGNTGEGDTDICRGSVGWV